MTTGKTIDRLCIPATLAALLLSVFLLCGASGTTQTQGKVMGYEDRLFDTSRVHTVDIRIDDWDAFLQTAQSEEYSLCDVVIDGEIFQNVGIRGKGNTSLSTVASMDSDRYSFKLEFDQYDSTRSYYGLDKLSLNNLIQDNTMMKDYLTYQMMNEFGVAAPLSSYVSITVNGEDWGLYLAVEAVEESFLQRNYGSDYGDLYKPDSMNMGGGRGNGQDFSPDAFTASSESSDSPGGTGGGRGMAGMGGFSISVDQEALQQAFEALGIDTALLDGIDFENITVDTVQSVLSALDADTVQKLTEKLMGTGLGGMGGGKGGFGMGSGETKLQYIDDDPDSYSTIFSSAKTDVSDADRARLIAALKALSEGSPSAVDTEAVLRYFVVHNYVVNGDSYTGSMVHNYYLYEKDGQLSMIPWDYNLAFGTFQGSSATDAVNDDIEAPLSVTGSDRPMIDWIFASEEYTELYRQYFSEFLSTVDIQGIIADTTALIAPYVEKDPTKFCTYEEFEKGAQTLASFCTLRSQSISRQLAGDAADVDASGISLSDMGTMHNGFGGGRGNISAIPEGSTDAAQGTQRPSMPGNSQMPQMPGRTDSAGSSSGTNDTAAGTQQFPGFGNKGGTDMQVAADGTALPEGMAFPEGMEDMLSGQTGNAQGIFSNGTQNLTQSARSAVSWILLAVTLAILAAGLLFASKFRR